MVSLERDAVKWVPIKQIAARLDEAAVARMSDAFYAKVWADSEHPAFRDMFVGNAASREAAVDAQWRWLLEMWGGPKRYSERFGDGMLLKRMLPKHGRARMVFRFCLRWMELMLASMEETQLAADDPAVAQSIRRYWLHFFSFFALSAAERRALRTLARIGD